MESIREAARHRPDVIILNLAVPLMDALEAGARGDLTVASEGQGSTFTVRLPQVS